MPLLNAIKNLFRSNGFHTDSKRSVAYNCIQFNCDPLQQWDIIGDLGDGAFGKVQKVQRRDSQLVAAAKAIELLGEEDFGSHLVEIEILSQHQHKNILGLYEVFFYEQTLWMMLEYCEGGAVDDIMVELEKPLTEPQIRFVCHELCEALSFLHSHNIIHRDIKAGNILLTGEGYVKLGDFGVSAKNVDPLQRRTTFIGTPFWMAPEVIQCETFKEQPYGNACDIWSLGVTLIELAEKDPPYHTMSPMRVLIKIQKSDPPCLADCKLWSHEFHNFLTRCLVKNPADRDSADRLLRHPFISGRDDPKPILQLLGEIKADIIAEVMEEIEDDGHSSHSMESSDATTPEAAGEAFNFVSSRVDRFDGSPSGAVKKPICDEPKVVKKRPAPREPPSSVLLDKQQDSLNSSANEILDALYESLSKEEIKKDFVLPSREQPTSVEANDASVEKTDSGVLRVTVRSSMDEMAVPSSSTSSPPTAAIPLVKQYSQPVRMFETDDECKIKAFGSDGQLTADGQRKSVQEIRANLERFSAAKLSIWKPAVTNSVDNTGAASGGSMGAIDESRHPAIAAFSSSFDAALPVDSSTSNNSSPIEEQHPPPEPPVDYEFNGGAVAASAAEKQDVGVLRKTSGELVDTDAAEKPISSAVAAAANGNVLARRNPHRRTVTKKTRVYMLDGVQVTSTTYHVMSDQDTNLYKAKEDFRLRKVELQEVRRMQRDELRQCQELTSRSKVQREQQAKKFEQDMQALLRDYESEVDSIMRVQKKQLEEAEKLKQDDMRIAVKKLRTEEEAELKQFREVLRQEYKLLKQEIDLLPKAERKDVYRQRKDVLDAQQMDRENRFCERLKHAHALTLSRLDNSHRQKIALLECQFLQQKHQMLRAREAALWELEERQLHERHQLLKNQMKESFFLQRSHMLVRHQKEMDHVKKVNQRKEDELVRAQTLERKRLPKILRSETKTRTMIFRESLKIRLQDSSDIAAKIREFEERERLRVVQQMKKQELKHRKRYELMLAENDAAVKELEHLQNEKRKLLLEDESRRLKMFDDEYTNDLQVWKAQLMPRKQILEEKFSDELNEQERFCEQTTAGSPSLTNSYISTALMSGNHSIPY